MGLDFKDDEDVDPLEFINEALNEATDHYYQYKRKPIGNFFYKSDWADCVIR